LWAATIGAGELVATVGGAGAPGAVTSLVAGEAASAAGVVVGAASAAEGAVVALGVGVVSDAAGDVVPVCGSVAAGVGVAVGGVDVALGIGLAGALVEGGVVGVTAGAVDVGLADSLAEEGGVGAGGVLSCATAPASPPSVSINAIPASLEAFEYSERLEAMALNSVPMLQSSKPIGNT
jgi:hypothetical protein